MKRLFACLVTLLLVLLCACGTQPAEPSTSVSDSGSAASSTQEPSPLDIADQLVASRVFSEPLESLDSELAPMIYQLDSTLVPTELRAYRSSGATCEEVAVFVFATQADADAAHTGLKAYLDAQLGICRNYRPAQVPKLEHALLEQRDNVLVLVVANDWTAAAELLK